MKPRKLIWYFVSIGSFFFALIIATNKTIALTSGFVSFLIILASLIVIRSYILNIPMHLRGETLGVNQKVGRLIALLIALIFYLIGWVTLFS